MVGNKDDVDWESSVRWLIDVISLSWRSYKQLLDMELAHIVNHFFVSWQLSHRIYFPCMYHSRVTCDRSWFSLEIVWRNFWRGPPISCMLNIHIFAAPTWDNLLEAAYPWTINQRSRPSDETQERLHNRCRGRRFKWLRAESLHDVRKCIFTVHRDSQ